MALCPHISSADGDPVVFYPYDCIGEDCQLWSVEDSECSIKMTEIIMKHIHNSHRHQREHDCEEGFTLTCGAPMGDIVLAGIVPKANVLVAEFVGNEDLDDNSLIYGKDFKIDPNDSEIPLMLKVIDDHSDNIATVTMLWQDYLSSL